MKRYYRPRTLGPKINHGEATYYVVLDDSLLEGFLEMQVPMRVMKPPVSKNGLTLVVSH